MHHAALFRFVAALVIACWASSAVAETRGVAIVLARDKDDVTKVTIHSDVKDEKKKDVSVAEAAKVIEGMEGWGSTVMVCIVADANEKLGLSGIPTTAELSQLLKAVEKNHWLSLVYLRVGHAKTGDDLVNHFIKSTSGK